MSYSIDISDTPKGTYTKVKNALEDNTVDWDYAKPIFSFECDETTLSELTSDLSELDLGVEVHDDSGTTALAEAAAPEAAPAPDPESEPAPEPVAAAPQPAMYVAHCKMQGLTVKLRGQVTSEDSRLKAEIHATAHARGLTVQHIDVIDGDNSRVL